MLALMTKCRTRRDGHFRLFEQEQREFQLVLVLHEYPREDVVSTLGFYVIEHMGYPIQPRTDQAPAISEDLFEFVQGCAISPQCCEARHL